MQILEDTGKILVLPVLCTSIVVPVSRPAASYYPIKLLSDFICRSYQNKTGKLLGLWEAMRPVIPAISLFSMMIIWAVFSSCDILELYPRLVYLTTGTVFSNIAVSSFYLSEI